MRSHRHLFLPRGGVEEKDAAVLASAGEDSAIGHLYMLARTFRQMLVILEKNVRDQRAIWQALWQGLSW